MMMMIDLQEMRSESLSLSSEYSNHEGKEDTVPMATPKPKTVSSIKVVKYRTRLRPNGVVSH